MKKLSTILVGIIFLLSISSLKAQWNIQTVDNADNVGEYSDVAYDSQGIPHIVYYDNSHDDLKYAKWTGTGWAIETLASSSESGKWCNIEIDSSDGIHVVYRYSYYDYPHDYYKIVYRWKFPDGSWESENIYDSSTSDLSDLSFFLKEDNQFPNSVRPYCCFHRNGNLKIVYPKIDQYNQLYYHSQTIDPGGDIGEYNDVVVDDSNNVYVSYFEDGDDDLKFAFYNNSTDMWSTTIIDGLNSSVGSHTSIILDENEVPHITYYDATNNDLKHATISEATMRRLKSHNSKLLKN